MIVKLKKFLDALEEENIFFKKHFFDRVKERPISESLIIKYLKKTETLLKVELLSSTRVKEEKFKLWFKLSNRYSLVVIVAIKGKDLYIITAWNSDRKWQKSIQK
jgi:hypothetical protein